MADKDDDKPVSLVSYKLTKTQQSLKDLYDSIEYMRANIHAIEEANRMQAQIRKSIYDSHIEAGFTPEQALEICKNV